MEFLKNLMFGKNKEKASPTGPIADAFKEYISNEIPSRLIDTSKMQFVSRKDVFRFFQDEIASVTEKQIQERMGGLDSDPFATYEPLREIALRQIIQEVVQYVILSHRWDQTVGEPGYQDISGGPRSVSRFKKLHEFCKTSSKLGHKLVWVDSCCIDQTNAVEVSEAIHAMYKWYANSHLCIAYLAESTSLADWDGDSWFTRGWTLQELLAPKRLKFYTKEWKPLINLKSVVDDRQHELVIFALQKVTGISKRVLNADNTYGVQGCTFWEIMYWASKRQTTRIEDRAYCLIGLFRVHLHISYGEGQKAFPRLVKAIMAQNPRWDVFAWFGQPCIHEVALPPSPASYPRYESRMSEGRVGVQEVSFTNHGLSLRSLPPVPLELGSVETPTQSSKPYLIELRPQPDTSLGTYGHLVVECGAKRLRTIRCARRLSACIMNHYPTSSAGTRRCEESKGRLIVGEEYICILLYSSDQGGSETTWLKLTTDNLLRITFAGKPEAISGDGKKDSLTLPLVTTAIHRDDIMYSESGYLSPNLVYTPVRA